MPDITRRTFIKGLAALAALAVAPSIPAALVETEHQRILRLMKTGRITNETFYLDGGIVIENCKNLMIDHCRFIFKSLRENEPMVEIGAKCEDIYIFDNVFEGPPGSYSPWISTVEA